MIINPRFTVLSSLQRDSVHGTTIRGKPTNEKTSDQPLQRSKHVLDYDSEFALDVEGDIEPHELDVFKRV